MTSRATFLVGFKQASFGLLTGHEIVQNSLSWHTAQKTVDSGVGKPNMWTLLSPDDCTSFIGIIIVIVLGNNTNFIGFIVMVIVPVISNHCIGFIIIIV